MNKNVLLRMSQEVLVIPFEEDIAASLDEFCHSQINGITYDRMAELIFCFVLRGRDKQLENELANFMEDNSLEGNFSPQVVMPVLIEYIVLLIIEEAPTEGQKATFSLMLKNALLGVIKGTGNVMGQEAIVATFNRYMLYLENEKTFVADYTEDVLSSILDSAPETGQFTFKSDENKAKVRSLMYDAAIHKYHHFVDCMEAEGESNILKAYHIAEKLANDTLWMYVDKTPAQTIKHLFGKFGIDNEKVEIKDIVNELSQLYEDEEKTFNATSILLCLITGGVDICKMSYADNKLELLDFAVYMYYELQAERMMNENEIKEEDKSNGE